MQRLPILALTAVASALAAPNFSGDWKMDAAKSDWGVVPPPSSLAMSVDHKDPDLRVHREQTGGPTGNLKTDAFYRVDGKPHTNRVGDVDGISTLAWSGDKLQVKTTTRFQGQEIVLNDEWSLEESGAALVIQRKIETAQGVIPIRMHLAKASGPAAKAAATANGKLSGKWKMNAGKSEFGFVPPFQEYEWEVEQNGANMSISRRSVTQRGDSVSSAKFVTDGSDAVLKVDQREGKLNARWEGDVLVMTSQWQARNGEFTLIERWTLAADGKSILADTVVKATAGEFPIKVLMERQ